MASIYIIRNNVNLKVYIGHSTRVHSRFLAHKKKANDLSCDSPLYALMREIGVENFTFEIIEEIKEGTRDSYLEAEQRAIKSIEPSLLLNRRFAYVPPSERKEYYKFLHNRAQAERMKRPEVIERLKKYDYDRWRRLKNNPEWLAKRNEKKRLHYLEKRKDEEWLSKERERNKLRMRERRKKLKESASETERPSGERGESPLSP